MMIKNGESFLRNYLDDYKEENDGMTCTGKFEGCKKCFLERYMACTGSAFARNSSNSFGSKILRKEVLKSQHKRGFVPIPFCGHLFEVVGNEKLVCCSSRKGSQGMDASTHHQMLNPTVGAGDELKTCKAFIQIRSIKLYIDHPIKNVHGTSFQKRQHLEDAKDNLMKALSEDGNNVLFKIVHYVRFPLTSAHYPECLLDGNCTNNRLHPAVSAKIKALAREGFLSPRHYTLPGVTNVVDVQTQVNAFVKNTLLASFPDDARPSENNSRYFPSVQAVRNHVALAQLPTQRKTLSHSFDVDHVCEEFTNETDDDVDDATDEADVSGDTSGSGGAGVIAIHLGAGYHSTEKLPLYTSLCQEACVAAVDCLRRNNSAGQAVVAAMKILENSGLTNAGYGSNLTEDGKVECEASVMDASHDRYQESPVYGAVASVSTVKNPVCAAYQLARQQVVTPQLSLGRIPPCMMVGKGAEDWSKAHGIECCEMKDLISESAQRAWTEYHELLMDDICRNSGRSSAEQLTDKLKVKRAASDRSLTNPRAKEPPSKRAKSDDAAKTEESSRLDTIGAVAVDGNGRIAAASSSGGLLMKLPGRIGQVATYGCGCWAENGSKPSRPSVAITSSGGGEHLVYSRIVEKCADKLRSGNCEPYQAVQRTLFDDFLNSPMLQHVNEKHAGLLTLHHKREPGLRSSS